MRSVPLECRDLFNWLYPSIPVNLRLSPAEARKLVLLSQRVLTSTRTGKALDATLEAIEHLGYIQIDTISVIERAHHHTLWNRNPRYQPRQLDRLVAEGQVYEYWSHAAAYLPMRDYRFSLPRMKLEAANRGHWHQKDPSLMKSVLKRVEQEGPLMARNFEDPNPGKKTDVGMETGKIRARAAVYGGQADGCAS